MKILPEYEQSYWDKPSMSYKRRTVKDPRFSIDREDLETIAAEIKEKFDPNKQYLYDIL